MTRLEWRGPSGTRNNGAFTLSATLALALLCGNVHASDESGCDPAYTPDGQLMLPSNYREWYFASSSLGLTYGPSAPPPDAPAMFDTVFVSWEAYRHFRRTGNWPDRTMFILELRRSYTPEAVQAGSLVPGEVVAIEAEVKDVQRFGGNGWRFFAFDGTNGTIADRTSPIDTSAACYTCHAANTAVDNTFVQFYPALMEVAEQFGTIRPDWDPMRKF